MSKPKPGLSKSLVRTLSSAAQYPSSASNIIPLAPVSQHGSLSSFISLGLSVTQGFGITGHGNGKSAGMTTGLVQGEDTLVPTWDQSLSDIVVTYSNAAMKSTNLSTVRLWPPRVSSQSYPNSFGPSAALGARSGRRYSTVTVRPAQQSIFSTVDRAYYPSAQTVSLDAILAALELSPPPSAPGPRHDPGMGGFGGSRPPPSPRSAHQSLRPRTTNSLSPTINTVGPLASAQRQGMVVEAHVPSGGLNPEEGTNAYPSSLIFRLGASGLAKERLPTRTSPSPRPSIPPRQRSFPLPSVHSPSARELKSTIVGEDAYFTRPDGLCVADGVGAWAQSGRGGANAGRWSALLAHFCELEVSDWCEGRQVYSKPVKGKGKESERRERRALDPVEIMQRGYEKCLSCAISEGVNGSSTCLLALLYNSTLHIANLGDCCLLLIRQGKVVFRTEEMQHAFNFPLQATKLTPCVQVGTHSRDEPMKDAMRFDVPVKKGDIVVVGSDGLMDNMFDEDILETILSLPPSSVSPLSPQFPQMVSETLARRALQVSQTTTTTTPFMCAAIEEGIDFVGGKKDDISVLVGVVGDRDGEQGLGIVTSCAPAGKA
nr:hypothetical protein L204_00873 [Cryptococcus depauperatus CBS 7855]